MRHRPSHLDFKSKYFVVDFNTFFLHIKVLFCDGRPNIELLFNIFLILLLSVFNALTNVWKSGL